MGPMFRELTVMSAFEQVSRTVSSVYFLDKWPELTISVTFENFAVARASRVKLNTRFILCPYTICSPKLYISLMQPTVSQRCWRRGDKRVDDVTLGTPTLVLNSAVHRGLTTPLAQQELESHGPYRNHISKHPRRLPVVMADDPMPAPATIERILDNAKAAGEKFKTAIENGLTPATKTTAFFSYEITPVKPDSPDHVLCLDRFMKQFETQVSGVRIRTGV
jgi:hypothetical protein